MSVSVSGLEGLSGVDREEALRLIGGVVEDVGANPLLGVFPYVVQQEFLGAGERTVALYGGNQVGKTTSLCLWFVIQCVDVECLPEHLVGFKRFGLRRPFEGRLCTPSFGETLQGVVFPKLKSLIPVGQLRGGSWESAYSKQLHILHFENGSWINFMSYEQPDSKAGGATLDAVGYDEEPPELLREEGLIRIAVRRGVERFALTPLSGSGIAPWMWRSVWKRRDELNIRCVVSNWIDPSHAPHLSEELKDELRREFEGSPERLRARETGLHVHFKGGVYPGFDRGRHVVPVPSPEDLKGQEIVVGIDPGVRWAGVSFLAFDGDNVCLVFDEIKVSKLNSPVEDLVALIREKCELWDVEPDLFVIDPSARNSTGVNAEDVEGAFQRAGLWVIEGQNRVQAGIIEISRRIANDALLVSEGCTNWLEECEEYRLDDRPDGRFAVVKENDHVMDSTRYGCMERVWWSPDGRSASSVKAGRFGNRGPMFGGYGL